MLECRGPDNTHCMRHAPHLLVSAAVMAAAADVGAMGFGRVLSRTTLGEPLNMAVTLRLEPGEGLDDGCANATVLAGDNPVPRDEVRVRITGGGDERILRVTTRRAIDEPVVTVTLAVGCPPRLTREFVTLADPPGFAAAQAAPLAGAPTPVAPPVDTPRSVAQPPATDAAAAPPPARPRRSTASTPPGQPSATTTTPARRVAAATAPAPRPRPAAPAPAPRLRLDITEPVRTAAAPAPQVAMPATPAASAPEVAPARPPALAASAPGPATAADDARVRALEDELARMRAEAKAQRDAIAALQSRLAQQPAAAARADSGWLPWLLAALLGALAAGVLYLGARVRRLSAEQALVRLNDRGDSSLAPGDDSRPSPWAPAQMPEVEVTEHETTQSPPLPRQPDTMPHDPPHPAPAGLRQEVSIEQQIDLEQQADFFSALGQDDQAVDLLVTHLRGTGGTNPMPYLKLMEIHRRRGERDAYERTRERFNLRFNAVAPDWDSDPRGGRTLEDYPAVLARLEQAWWSPLDAMTELETLLFQRGSNADRFDMAAYQEIVMLYRMAREQRLADEQGKSSQVDVLLPLDDGRGAQRPAMQVRHVDIGPTTASPAGIDIELPGPFELDLPREDDPPRRR
jgi:pilus assembly protein FimV